MTRTTQTSFLSFTRPALKVASPGRVAVLLSLAFSLSSFAAEPVPIDIGNRRELFVDEFLLAKRDGIEVRLHSPVPREVVMTCDAPWEGSGCGYETVFRDGNMLIAAKK